MTQELSEIKGSTESRIDIKLESNSRGINWSIHCYQGVTEKEIDDCIVQAIYGVKGLQAELAAMMEPQK